MAKKGKPAAWYLFDAKNQRIAGPKPTRQEILDGRALIGKQKVRVQTLLKDGKLRRATSFCPCRRRRSSCVVGSTSATARE